MQSEPEAWGFFNSPHWTVFWSGSLLEPHLQRLAPGVVRQSVGYGRGEVFFERLLGLGVGFRVLRADREPAKPERGQLLAHGALVHLDAETRLDLALQVDTAPAHHPVHSRIGTLAHHPRQLGLLLRAQ